MGEQGREAHDIGFGAYRVEENVPEHRRALELYLDAGGRVIDTAASYTSGGSERLVGATLAGRGGADVTVVTKAGYVEPQAETRAPDGLRGDYPEAIDTGYGFAHCIHPRFLADALDRSLRRLRRPRVDALLLHNPEYFLTTHLGLQPRPDAAVRAEFRRRLTQAFAYLETRVAAGDLAGYGVSSNHIGRVPEDPVGVSVHEIVDAARQVASAPALTTVQAPFNLLERDVALPHPGADSALEAARAAGLAFYLNRPINAFRGQLVPIRDGRSTDARAEIFLDALRRALDRAGYDRLEGVPGWSLAHAALDLARSLPGVTSALNGMRRPAYVRIAQEVLAQPPHPRALDIVRALY